MCISRSKYQLAKPNEKSQLQITRKCRKQYVPLKKRTKTLADLKTGDSTENKKKALPYIERYENRRKKIMSKRRIYLSEIDSD